MDKEVGSYAFYNLIETNNKTYKADIVFAIKNLFKPESSNGIYTEEGSPIGGFIVYPVTITYEDSWGVTSDGEKKIYPLVASVDMGLLMGNDNLPRASSCAAKGETGTVTVSVQTVYMMDNIIVDSSELGSFFNTQSFNEMPKLNAEFYSGYSSTEFVYNYQGSDEDIENIDFIGILKRDIFSKEGDIEDENKSGFFIGDQTGSNSDGYTWRNMYIRNEWDGRITNEDLDYIDVTSNKIADIPSGYIVEVHFDGVLRETITIKGGDFIE